MSKTKNEEIRLGLVLYGGVSLAIYMNGVCMEFFRAIKGEGIYKLLKDVRDCSIVVDIISGSSMVGINGIMLAACLCNGLDFSLAKNIWIEKGDINKLLNAGRKKYKSIFDSEGFYEEGYIEFFNDLFDKKNLYKDNPETTSNVEELDLFITGTNFYGLRKTHDDKNYFSNVEIKNHGSLFQLKYRKKRNKNNLKGEPAAYRSLAKLARITSAFPGAFSPVGVPKKSAKEGEEYENLREWGMLSPETDYYFSDGGVVNNRPFSSTIEAIFSRTADKKIDRKLFYLEPDPEDLTELSPVVEPRFLKSIFTPMMGISAYQSVSEDINNVINRNKKLDKYFRYRDSLLIAFFIGSLEKDQNNINMRYYETVRCEYFYKIMIKSNIRDEGDKIEEKEKENVKNNLEILLKFYNEDNKSVFKDLAIFDVSFKQRRIYFIIYLIYEFLNPGDTKDPQKKELYSIFEKDINKNALNALWKSLNEIVEVYEIMKFHVDRHLNDFLKKPHALSPKQLYDETSECILKNFPQNIVTLDPDLGMDEERRTELHSRLNINSIADSVSGRTFFDDFKDYESKVINNSNVKLLIKLYDKFEIIDSFLFPYELNSDLLEKDTIEVVRFSSRNIRQGYASLVKPSNRILGTKLAHFSAFLKKDWRVNDIMWGRMDASSTLVDCLMNNSCISNLKSIKSYKDYFPWISDIENEELLKLSKTLTSEKDGSADFTKFKDLLIRHEQSNILENEFHLTVKEIECKPGEPNNNKTKRKPDLKKYENFFIDDYSKLNQHMRKLSSPEINLIFKNTLTALSGLEYTTGKFKKKLLKGMFVIFYPVNMLLLRVFVRPKMRKMFEKN